MMATSPVTDEDEVEFVSEGPLRPVVDYIDLLSDGENEDNPVHRTVEDQVDRQKAKVASTLDRLAHQVAAEKQERAEKCRAFKEKMVSQQAHGRQELAFNQSSGENRDAKTCVNMWLKMPGLRPGAVHTGFRRRRAGPCPTDHPQASTRTCPVANCGRVFDSVLLLEGHLKRFDHSPCDPSVLLKGTPTEYYACIACCKRFETKMAYNNHLKSKASSPQPRGPCQQSVLPAHPVLRLSLLLSAFQHQGPVPAAHGNSEPLQPVHHTERKRGHSCHAHTYPTLRQEPPDCSVVHCRQGGAVAEAAQTVAEVMRQLCAYGRCPQCQQTFLSEDEAKEHERVTQHEVEAFRTLQQSLLHYANHRDTQRRQQGAASAAAKRPGPRADPREKGRNTESPAKRQRHGDGATAWACECGMSFPEEAAAHRHLLAANQVFHMCGVCGKEMGEASITRLHMSRFHGGAHLSNFLFRCRRCKVDMPRQEDILSHVRDAHSGHTFYRERQPTEAEAASVSEAPAPSKSSSPAVAATPEPASRPSTSGRKRRWLCRMCEDVFNSEAAVRAHCGDVNAHSFQKFLCGDCDQRFFKERTLLRHCQLEHGGSVRLRHFCGLCDSMQHDSADDFLQHYRSLHGTDYCCVEEEAGPRESTPSSAATHGQSAETSCPCMATEKGKAERKAAFTFCMKGLAGSGRCTYACPPCGLQTPYYIQVKEHVHREHSSQGKHFQVICGSCQESYLDVPSFHTHYHAQHCPLEPCLSLRGESRMADKVLKAEEVSLETNAVEFEEVKHAVALSSNETKRDAEGNREECDEDLERALALSAEEARKQTELDREMEDALQRSLLEF
ncbi:hypothetical protein SKAU_G00165220 [Synaphobranchus kaupii]|uniref:C2H2-type domain-containing protein n=1 Tax=Synaphobranchus kaupii TaxID=118154 RepID=A0A9Q1FJT3_SYNKA|nr:hypothetical protein SKAU_G00165220 [Synaphobranchus kaupii]